MGVVQLIAVGVQGGLARQLHNRVEEVGVVDWAALVPQRQHSVRQSHRSVVIVVLIIVVVVAFEIIFFITPAIFGFLAIIVLAFIIFSVLLVLFLFLLIVPHLSKDARPEDARLAAVLEDAIEEDPDVVPVEEI